MNAAAYTLAAVVIGFAGQGLLARQRASTERALAHEARLAERRNDVYQRVVEACLRQAALVDHIFPIFETVPPPTPPENVTLDVAISLTAEVEAFGTRAVGEAVKAFSDSLRHFDGVVGSERAIHRQRHRGKDGVESYEKVEDARLLVRARYRDVVDAVRAETNPEPRAADDFATRLRARFPNLAA